MRLASSSAAVLCAFSVFSPVLIAAPTPVAPNQVTTQLPRTVRPSHYNVAITPDAEAARFTGHVTIAVQVLEPTSSITLNAAGLDFQTVRLLPLHGNAPSRTAQVSVDAAHQSATFSFAQKLLPGRYQLVLDYTGPIGSQAVGLFSLDYANGGAKKRALYTQFENSDARRMVPSWDEPLYKATFSLTVTVPTGQLAVSNMPIASTTPLADGRQRVAFKPSPKMSTYLLFFGLGEFERTTTRVGDTELGVITQKGLLSQGRFALDSSAAILREYNDYFGVRFPLPKLDNIAAPGRSAFFGAMENWGAIFTFEHALLLDPTISTQNDKQRIFQITAHEMAHQWFGDLVTMQWWDDLWLNEGFASWMEGRTTARLHPEWQTGLDAVQVRERAMNLDAFASTHPVVQHVDTVEQTGQAFDAITYSKGESVIRMLEHFVGAEAWRSGVRAYMKAHAYGNTATDDLWREIEKAAGQPITAIAHDFTRQSGIPMIRVESAQCHGAKSSVILSQSEFSLDAPGKAPLAWRVPVSVQIGANGVPTRTVVQGGRATLEVAGCGPVLVNAGQTGYYRTVYAAPLWKPLASNFANLAPIDQLGLLADTWALGSSGLQPMSDYLDLTDAAPLSAAPQVWTAIAHALDTIDHYYRNDAQRRSRFTRYAVARLTPVMTQVGWNARAGEAETVAPLREVLIRTLSNLDDPVTIAEARRRYAAPATDANAMPPALRRVVMSVVAQHADAPAWDALRRSAQTEKSPMIRNELYQFLATARDKSLATRAMAMALTDEPGVTISAGMLGKVAEQYPDVAFDFALANMDKVTERIDTTSRSRYFANLAANSSDPAMIVKVDQYAEKYLAPGSRRSAQTAIAHIKDRIRVITQRLPEIDTWLARKQG